MGMMSLYIFLEEMGGMKSYSLPVTLDPDYAAPVEHSITFLQMSCCFHSSSCALLRHPHLHLRVGNYRYPLTTRASLMAQLVKNPPIMQETWV